MNEVNQPIGPAVGLTEEQAAEAALELVRRRRASTSLFEFTRYTLPAFQPSLHHRVICDKLDQVVNGKIKRLLITMPPRSGKSELASRRLPAYYMGRFPTRQIICATYNSDFASDFGREVRNVVEGDLYQSIFPDFHLAADAKAANRFNTNKGGTYFSTGIGAGLTGRGAHLGIIDDPVRSREDADSKHYRDRVWSWYRSVFFTRLMPGASIILVLTHWHDDDLAGRLLMEGKSGGEKWEHLNLPALAQEDDPLGRKPGEALWPQWYPEPVLENIRNTIGPREWSALYQQEPVEDEGAYFKRDWVEDNRFDREDVLSRWKAGVLPLHIYGASDYAVTADGGDYTVHLVMGIDANEDLYILDIWRGQTETVEWVEAFCDLVDKWKPLRWGEESGQILKSVGPYLERRMRERKSYCARDQYASTADKATRARAIQARMAMGKVRFPHSAPYLDSLIYELLRFPAGVYDDQVDALSLIGRMLTEMSAAPTYRPEAPPDLQPTSWGDLYKAHRQNRRHGIGKHRQAPVIHRII